jgi:hypothetical protein
LFVFFAEVAIGLPLGSKLSLDHWQDAIEVNGQLGALRQLQSMFHGVAANIPEWCWTAKSFTPLLRERIATPAGRDTFEVLGGLIWISTRPSEGRIATQTNAEHRC